MADTPLPDSPDKPEKRKPRLTTWDRLPDYDPHLEPTDIDWQTPAPKGRGLLRRIEHLALWFKEPVNKLVGTSQLNPLYYSGTIAFFLFVVVVLTGVYILMFFQYGYDVTYTSVESMERFFISRAARAIHRYASGGLIIFSILHAIRMLFMDRFRGPRWTAWVGGVVTTFLIWLAGITGYWLLWDEGAQLITQSVLNLLQTTPALATSFYFTFLDPAVADEQGWILILLITAVHLLLTIVAGLFYWVHIMRLQRPKFFPPRYWMIGMGALLVIAGLFFPAGLLPPADFTRVPDTTPLDPIFLFYLPPALRSAPVALWLAAGVVAVVAMIAVIPWLFPREKLEPVTIAPERCTGCQHCVYDCPYGALSMVPRTDDLPYAQVAVVNDSRCVSCGICIGSCDTMAISLGELKPERLWQNVSRRLTEAKQTSDSASPPIKVIFTCERHAAHGGHTYVQAKDNTPAEPAAGPKIEVIPVTCVAMVNPGLITHAVEAGATEVQVVGCPPNDCTNREGNVWMEERLHRTRSPKLKPSYQDAAIFTTWLAPDHFQDALPLHAAKTEAEQNADAQHPPTTFNQILAAFNRRNLIITVVLLALGLLLQVRFTYTPYHPTADSPAVIQVAVQQTEPGSLLLTIDGETALATVDPAVYQRIRIVPGEHHVRLTLQQAGQETVLFDETVMIEQGTALPLTFTLN